MGREYSKVASKHTKASSKMDKKRAKECTDMSMEMFMKVSLKMAKKRAKEYLNILMVHSTKASSNRDGGMD